MKDKVKSTMTARDSSSNMVYCLGIIGAAFYYLNAATNLWGGIVGLLKAFVWPVFLVYDALKFLSA